MYRRTRIVAFHARKIFLTKPSFCPICQVPFLIFYFYFTKDYATSFLHKENSRAMRSRSRREDLSYVVRDERKERGSEAT